MTTATMSRSAPWSSRLATSPSGTPFSDVLQSNTFCDEIAWLTQTGITQGTDTGFSLEDDS